MSLFKFEERFCRNFPAYIFLVLVGLNDILYLDLNQLAGEWNEHQVCGSDG